MSTGKEVFSWLKLKLHTEVINMSLGHNIAITAMIMVLIMATHDLNDDSGDEVSDNTIGLQARLLFIFILTLAILEAIKKPDF